MLHSLPPSAHTVGVMAVSVLMAGWLVSPCRGHGRLVEPPSRASMWRQGYDNPHNYDDNQLFCGGVGVQYGQNGGKCGVCGDPWDGPREHEAGGKFANGIIARKYHVGQAIDVVVELTANHKGYFEFHLCPTDNPFQKVTHDCLKKYPLVEVTSGKTRYPVLQKGYGGKFSLKLRLPRGVRCRACMLQWKYNAGNSWGEGPDGVSCVGCGNQEQFYGCADIAVGNDDVKLGQRPVKHPWYFQEEDTDWHYGVVKTVDNDDDDDDDDYEDDDDYDDDYYNDDSGNNGFSPGRHSYHHCVIVGVTHLSLVVLSGLALVY